MMLRLCLVLFGALTLSSVVLAGASLAATQSAKRLLNDHASKNASVATQAVNLQFDPDQADQRIRTDTLAAARAQVDQSFSPLFERLSQ